MFPLGETVVSPVGNGPFHKYDNRKELCQFVVETPQGGTIDEDGKYMAPVTKGIYKINAIGNESQHVAYAMVVVKGT